jgi:hypothetical protein
MPDTRKLLTHAHVCACLRAENPLADALNLARIRLTSIFGGGGGAASSAPLSLSSPTNTRWGQWNRRRRRAA